MKLRNPKARGARFPLAVAVIAFAFVACGEDAAEAPAGPASPPPTKAPTSTSKFADIRVSHILIAMEGRKKPVVKRTKAQALEIAQSVLKDVQGGRDFLEAASKFSDDVDAAGKPNTNCGEPGSYQGTFIEGFVKPFQEALLKTPVGSVNPEPVYADPFGYFVIKRAK